MTHGRRVPHLRPRLPAGCSVDTRIEVRETGTDRGRGAFATQPICCGEWLGVYRGEHIDAAELQRRYGDGLAPYALCVGASFIDAGAAGCRGDWTAMVNDARGTGRPVNVEFRGRGAVYAVAAIAVGEELLVDYGADYWLGSPIANLPLLHPRMTDG